MHDILVAYHQEFAWLDELSGDLLWKQKDIVGSQTAMKWGAQHIINLPAAVADFLENLQNRALAEMIKNNLEFYAWIAQVEVNFGMLRGLDLMLAEEDEGLQGNNKLGNLILLLRYCMAN